MFKQLPSDVKIVEVGARDGLQNEKVSIATDDKVTFIGKLIEAGLKTIEVTSFVKAESIPQMADAVELYKKVSASLKGAEFPCLVPNQKGFETAQSLGVKYIALFSATSDSFTKKNINATVEESFEKMAPIAAEAKKQNLKIRGYISTAFGCPYEKEIPVKKTLEVIERFFKLGVDEVSVGDTIGVANSLRVQEMILALKNNTDLKKVAMHFHDTRGTALSNVLVSLENGITIFDSSAGGLGGCPYAKGATGNVATEDVLYLLNNLGIKTGLDMKKLSEASVFILGKLGRETQSKYLKAFLSSGY